VVGGMRGTLGGTGAVGAIVTNGGTVAPGFNSIDSLDAISLNMALGGIFALEINSNPTATSDKLTLSTGLTLSPGTLSQLNGTDLGASAITLGTKLPFILYNAANPVTGVFSIGSLQLIDDTTEFMIGLNTFVVDYNDGGDKVSLVVVPEPGTIGSLIGGFGVLLGLRRRKARRA